MSNSNPTPTNDRELVISRVLNAPRDLVYRAWTNPDLLSKWWTPRPWSTPVVEMDLKPGGVFRTVMKDPEGNEYPNAGVFLEVTSDKIVFTDAFTPGWFPNPDPFILAIITFEEEDGKTRYTARVRHFSVEAKEKHEEMGFHDGWGTGLSQFEEILATLV
ncbi:polyketide cyclase [bacterium]|nr:MAG: polyketide cyclase [bacterium]